MYFRKKIIPLFKLFLSVFFNFEFIKIFICKIKFYRFAISFIFLKYFFIFILFLFQAQSLVFFIYFLFLSTT